MTLAPITAGYPVHGDGKPRGVFAASGCVGSRDFANRAARILLHLAGEFSLAVGGSLGGLRLEGGDHGVASEMRNSAKAGVVAFASLLERVGLFFDLPLWS